jgi:hypothetical protein
MPARVDGMALRGAQRPDSRLQTGTSGRRRFRGPPVSRTRPDRIMMHSLRASGRWAPSGKLDPALWIGDRSDRLIGLSRTK